jgi:hypothetical protein
MLAVDFKETNVTLCDMSVVKEKPREDIYSITICPYRNNATKFKSIPNPIRTPEPTLYL